MATDNMETKPRLRVAFLHPDLGIGGAERLVVDAATGIQSKGHHTVIYTSHHDPKHCFEETRDGTLRVSVHGNSLPRSIFGRFYIVCAILRQLVLTLYILLWEKDSYDVMVVDQLSACLPLLTWFSSAKIMFYCHFPDKLLTSRESTLKQLYRVPLDKLEEWTTGMADTVVVNSGFTAGIFRRSFPSIFKTPRILYPPINTQAYDRAVDTSDPSVQLLETNHKIILSINRFERKKNVELALRAFAALKTDSLIDPTTFGTYRLVLAGGYDRRVAENVEYLESLNDLATQFGLKTFVIHPSSDQKPPEDAQVVFVCSFNDAQRTYLLANALMLLYTPSNEHFGITPVEGMYCSVPVIACNNGGPLESVKDTLTGLLIPPTPELWANGIRDLITEKYDVKAMGEAGRRHVLDTFSLEAFADQLEDILEELVTGGRVTHHRYDNVEYGVRVFVAALLVYIWYSMF
ncbi:glycosyltransferase family 4 protein [Phycomyces blakesleeanus]